MKRIKVPLKARSYDILIGKGLLESCGRMISNLKLGSDAVVITNDRLAGLYKKGLVQSLTRAALAYRFELVPDSETAKSSNVAMDLINRLSSYDVHKEIFLIAFGGGVVGDLTGFVASLYKRGVSYIQIPTTLLAQVDSAIGGKVAIDLPMAKNMAGAFYQPKIVISDISFLSTLSRRQLSSGLAEAIKYGVIKDRALFMFLEKNLKKVFSLDENALEYVVVRCSKIKAGVVAKDEYDRKGIRAILNYGHTIGHAIEAAAGYSDLYNHGEAIAVGMVIAAEISQKLGMIKSGEVDRIRKLIALYGLPTSIKGVSFSKIYEAHFHDKKFTHKKNRFVLPTEIGKVKVVEDVPDTVIKDVLKTYVKSGD